jgi:GNAT superfamily N-acetyltransferase
MRKQEMDWFIPQDFLSQVTIRPFEREDQGQARQLILNGLAEHWGWLDPSKNPDLDDIAACYAGGVFLVAEHRGEIVGTGGLLPGVDGSAQIVRVHVAEHFRLVGVGSLIMDKLSERARSLGFMRLVLETTATWEDAIAFYQRLGFQITHHLNGDVYMAKQLELETQSKKIEAR